MKNAKAWISLAMVNLHITHKIEADQIKILVKVSWWDLRLSEFLGGVFLSSFSVKSSSLASENKTINFGRFDLDGLEVLM